MNSKKKERLAAHGWKTGGVEELLGLTREETAYVELRVRLSDAVRTLRRKRSLTAEPVPGLLHSSQSRVGKAEAGDRSVSLGLLIRSPLALGATDRDLANVIDGKSFRSVCRGGLAGIPGTSACLHLIRCPSSGAVP